MNLNLFTIQQEYAEITNELIESGGELTPFLEEALAINKANLETKATNYGFVIKSLDYECDIIDSEIARLQGLKKARIKVSDRLKDTLTKAMELYEVSEIKCPTLKISFRKSETVEVENIALLDGKFLVEKTTVTPDKVGIKKAIQSGEVVEGAVIVEHNNIQIK